VHGSWTRAYACAPSVHRTVHVLSVNRAPNRAPLAVHEPCTPHAHEPCTHEPDSLDRRQRSRRRPRPRLGPHLVPRAGHRRAVRLADPRPLRGLFPRSGCDPAPIIWARLGARESPSAARPAITGTPGGRLRGDAPGARAVSRVRWAIRPDGTLRPVATGPRVHCTLCGSEVSVRSAWQVPKGSGEWYCRDHWSTDDRRLRHEFEEVNP
jgi:hypothetical protein